jgi:alpha-L-arabinofuranosidase
VIEALKELKIPIVRYPDGVLSLAWRCWLQATTVLR